MDDVMALGHGHGLNKMAGGGKGVFGAEGLRGRGVRGGWGVEIAYEETAECLRLQVREAALDHEAFRMPLKLCELKECRATCCHDGVYLETGEREEIQRALSTRMPEGWEAKDWFENRDGRWKSATLEAGGGMLWEEFPAHFPRTRCVFLDREHKCVLQRIAMEEGRHPWFWKPVSCWMHPLVLVPGRRGGRPMLTLARPGDDPAAGPEYPGFSSHTPCGMACDGGRPAYDVLAGELELLGKIAGRDVAAELRG